MQTATRNGRTVRLIPTPVGHKLQDIDVDYKKLYEQAVAQASRFSQEYCDETAEKRYWYQRAMENEVYREAWEREHRFDNIDLITVAK
ncbi:MULTISPECIES: hypothetical protein [Lactococcus]|uniref:hypothetical protein n=1 Tax=Lactococcus TaxID=1357 RepID=UPI001CDD530C|nr:MULTISPECIES: hypothetical protein [Lactococcus]MCA2391218.1 hypothetical protein [Lactococcus sp. NH2-7C]WGV31378.1 hypothetical protein QJV49_05080 [Lactococcus sp. NH2-7C]